MHIHPNNAAESEGRGGIDHTSCGPFACTMDPGERESPPVLPLSEGLPLNIEGLCDTRGSCDFFNSPSVCRAGWFRAKPGCVLEDALRAGVMNELLPPDETLLHRKPTPGAEAIRKVGWGRRVQYRWGDMSHGDILSDRREPCQSIEWPLTASARKKVSISSLM